MVGLLDFVRYVINFTQGQKYQGSKGKVNVVVVDIVNVDVVNVAFIVYVTSNPKRRGFRIRN